MKSFRVMKTNEFEDAVCYRIACACGSDEHDVTIEFEINKEIPNMLFINFYKDMAWCSHWGSPSFLEKIWLKIKAVFKIIFTGYIELNESFILEGDKHIKEVIEVLEEGYEYIKKQQIKMEKNK